MTETADTAPRDSSVLAGAPEGLRVVPCQAATVFGDTVFGVRSMAIVCMIAASGAVCALTVVLFDDRRLGVWRRCGST